MKKSFFTLLCISLFGWSQAQNTTPVVAAVAKESVKTVWESTSHNFGEIKYQVPQTVSFTFTNQSAQPVIISEAKGSCGCTVASFTPDPIAPGATGTVKATYNAATLGAFNKTVSVKTTAQDTWQTLKITGIVVE
ncbi:MAG: DUF1573 domain-containing protein [Cyclobacteriaceae bacterium]